MLIAIVNEVMIFTMLMDIKLIVENIYNRSIIEIIVILIMTKLLCMFDDSKIE